MSTLVGWWKGEDNTVDSVNGVNGIWYQQSSYLDPIAAYSNGETGRCFKIRRGYYPTGDPMDTPDFSNVRIPHSGLHAFSSSGATRVEISFYVATDNVSDGGLKLFKLRITDGAGGYQIYLYPDTSIWLGLMSNYYHYPIGSFNYDSWNKLKFTYNNGVTKLYAYQSEAWVELIPDVEPTDLLEYSADDEYDEYILSGWFGTDRYMFEHLIDEIKLYNDFSGLVQFIIKKIKKAL